MKKKFLLEIKLNIKVCALKEKDLNRNILDKSLKYIRYF